MKNKIQEQVLKEVKKYIPFENAPMEYSQKNVEKAISRTIELMEKQNNHLHSTLHCKLCKSMSLSGVEEK